MCLPLRRDFYSPQFGSHVTERLLELLASLIEPKFYCIATHLSFHDEITLANSLVFKQDSQGAFIASFQEGLL